MRSLLAFSLVALAVACGTPGAPAASSSAPAATSGGPRVDYQGLTANPASLSVAMGTTVTWTNKDSVEHTVTSGAGRVADGKFASVLAKNETFSFAFNDVGTFEYFCANHRLMTGFTVVVK